MGTTDDVVLDYVVSSLGSVNMDLITAIYHAAQGGMLPLVFDSKKIIDIAR